MLRRSSTHRSIGARSDWASSAQSEAEDDNEVIEPISKGEEDRGRRWTIFQDDPEKKAAKETADEHVHNYVQDQLRRLMSPDGPTAGEDELETHLNGN